MKTKDLERPLRALASRRRLDILQLLKRDPGTSVGEIARAIGLSFRTTSKHLAILSAEDIVETKRTGLYVLYRLCPKQPLAAKRILALL